MRCRLRLTSTCPTSGDTFGSAYDGLAAHGQLVVPDLLGFGRSEQAEWTGVSLQGHLTALDAMGDALDLNNRRLVVTGHSMGALLAWQWAGADACALTVLTHPTGDHLLPLDHPGWCVQALAGAISASSSR